MCDVGRGNYEYRQMFIGMNLATEAAIFLEIAKHLPGGT